MKNPCPQCELPSMFPDTICFRCHAEQIAIGVLQSKNAPNVASILTTALAMTFRALTSHLDEERRAHMFDGLVKEGLRQILEEAPPDPPRRVLEALRQAARDTNLHREHGTKQ